MVTLGCGATFPAPLSLRSRGNIVVETRTDFDSTLALLPYLAFLALAEIVRWVLGVAPGSALETTVDPEATRDWYTFDVRNTSRV